MINPVKMFRITDIFNDTTLDIALTEKECKAITVNGRVKEEIISEIIAKYINKKQKGDTLDWLEL